MFVTLLNASSGLSIASVESSAIVLSSSGDSDRGTNSLLQSSDVQELKWLKDSLGENSFLKSNGVDAFAIVSSSHVALYSISKAGKLEFNASVDAAESLYDLAFFKDGTLGAVTKSGKCYVITRESSKLSDPIETGFHGRMHVAALGGSKMIVSCGVELKVVDFDSRSDTACEIVGIPEEMSLIQGMTRLEKEGEIAILGVSDEGVNVFILLCHLDGAKLTCLQYSENEIFLSADWTMDSFGLLQYVPEIRGLLVGHTLSDSVALLVQKQEDTWECLLMPEGKQLNCSLLEGDSSTSFLRSLSYCVLSDAVDIPGTNEMVACKFIVSTVQIDGWATFHYGETPSDWLFSRINSGDKKAACTKSEAKSAPNPLVTAPQPPLFSPSIKAEVKTAQQPPLFNPSIQGEVKAAPPPPLFNPSIQAEVKTAPQPPLFNPSIKAEVKTAPQPPLFNPSIKAEVKTAPQPPLFNPSIKAEVKTAQQPPLFNPSIQAEVKTAPQPPLFNVTETENPEKSGSLFGSFGKVETAETKSSLFGSFGQSQTTTASAFGSFGSSAAAQPSSSGLFGAPTLGKAPSLFEKTSVETKPVGLFGTPSKEAQGLFSGPSESSGSKGLFGASSLGTPSKEPKATLSGQKTESSASLGKTELSPSLDKISISETPKPRQPYTGPKLDESLIESFEKQLKDWEKIVSASTRKPVVAFNPDSIISLSPSSLEAERSSLLKLREEMNTLDTQVRDAYAQDPSQVSFDEVDKLEAKCAKINQQLDMASVKARKLARQVARSPIPKTIRSFPSSPTTPLPLFHPLPPSLRRDPAGGYGLVSPIKPRDQRPWDYSKRDSFSPRVSITTIRETTKENKRQSLGDLLTGKILGSPPSRRAPTIPNASGHAASWQLLRQVEQQRKKLEEILRVIDNLSLKQ